MRSRRKIGRLGEQASIAQARAVAYDDARALAVELGRGVSSSGFDAMSAGLVLLPGETAYRWVQVWIMVQHDGCWAPPSWAQILVTDQRLLCRCGDGRLVSLYWSDVVGMQIALDQQSIILNYGDHAPVALSGVETAVIAVAAVATLYGVSSLLAHPALAALRCPSSSGNDSHRPRAGANCESSAIGDS